MKLVYAIINFLILAVALYFIGRKMVVRKFRERKERIAPELERAQQAHEDAERAAAEIAAAQADAAAQSEALLDGARRQAQSGSEAAATHRQAEADMVLYNAGQSEQYLREEMYDGVRAGAIRKAAELTRGVVAQPEFAHARQTLTEQFLQQVGDLLTATPSDELKIQSAQALGITVTTAEALSDAEQQALRAILHEKLLPAGGDDTAIRDVTFAVDANVLGGVRLRVGDTVYDDTLSHQLDRLTQDAANGVSSHAVGADEIADAVKETFRAANDGIDVFQTGEVVRVSDGICRVSGLSDVMAGELLVFQDGLRGMVMDLEPGNVGVVLLGSFSHVQEGESVRRTGRIMEVPVGECMIGRVVNALGHPIDGKGSIRAEHFRAIESPAPSVLARKPVSVPLQTGIKAIDALVPIGRGQRELIIGDRQTGKTAIAIDAILSQKGKDVLCIYVAIGQKESTVASVVARLREFGAMEYTTVVCADASESAPMLYIAPYAGAAMGEYFMYQGKDVLIVYDDLSKQAVAYREISLLLQRPPGREAYPGDVFYLHSRLLERAARLNEENGGGSMTALPIIETQAGDISAYIPTNVISITDGQIFLETDLFHAGVRPAINVGLSVSRVGGAAQIGAMKQVAGRLRMDLAQYRELAAFSQFGSDLDKSTRQALLRGAHMTELLKQGQYAPMDAADQVIAIFAAGEGYADDVELQDMARFEAELLASVNRTLPALHDAILTGKKLSAEQLSELRGAIEDFKKTF